MHINTHTLTLIYQEGHIHHPLTFTKKDIFTTHSPLSRRTYSPPTHLYQEGHIHHPLTFTKDIFTTHSPLSKRTYSPPTHLYQEGHIHHPLTFIKKDIFTTHSEEGRGSNFSPSERRYVTNRSGQQLSVLMMKSCTGGSARRPDRDSSKWSRTGLLVLKVTE